uniref:Uncharacterized protein n=1 Tax=Panagrolaimus sp. ES5 TaxID=591445 RepID=A0AC34GRX9_9BILA
MTQHAQQLRFSERENEEESLKFLKIFAKHYLEIDKSCKLFWRTILEECQKQNILPQTTVVQLYSEIWPNFLHKARNNFYTNGLTKVDQIVMDISKTRNPHWWGPPVASKNARARAIRDFNPPKVKIIEPQHVATAGSGRRKRKDAENVTPASAPAPKVAKTKKNAQMNTEDKTPVTSKPRQPRRRKQPHLPTTSSETTPSHPLPGPAGFKLPPPPLSISNPTTLSTIASLIRSLSAAQSSAAATTTSSSTVTPSSLLPTVSSNASTTVLTTPQIPKPPHPTPATPAAASTEPYEHFNLNFLPRPPEPPKITKLNIQPQPTINDSDLPSDSTTKTDVNKNFLKPFQDSSPFRLILSSSSEEEEEEEEEDGEDEEDAC